MSSVTIQEKPRRYQEVEAEKAHGATYTPDNLAKFVAQCIVNNADVNNRTSISILDPAIGDGALVLAMLETLASKTIAKLTITGFDTDRRALDQSALRIRAAYPDAKLELVQGNFLDFVLEHGNNNSEPSLFTQNLGDPKSYDIVIANPPYVRTQIMGADRAQQLATAFGLNGRVDLYHAFLLGIAQVLRPDGAAGIIVSNRFMTTKGGGGLRASLRQLFALRQVWDLGDTKIFNAAVLPAVLIAKGTFNSSNEIPLFSSIYEVKDQASLQAIDAIDALKLDGIVEINDGRRFCVRHGVLDTSGNQDDVWRIASKTGDKWMATVDRHTWKRFGEIGKIRVGVKTCADKVFIRHDWENYGTNIPELLRPLTTHHGAGRFRGKKPKVARSILYPHEVVQGNRQSISLEGFPNSRAYLEANRETLESRSYVIEAGRRWYELWVPQDPQAWLEPKLVFRDISEKPTFWMDLDGTVVNGDCYWLTASEGDTDMLWLAAAVANSTFAEAFYDHRFNNKLYAGRRRFITQYVEQFPLPDPALLLSQEIISCSKAIYEANHSPNADDLERAVDEMVWKSFGLGFKEVTR